MATISLREMQHRLDDQRKWLNGRAQQDLILWCMLTGCGCFIVGMLVGKFVLGC